jgi:hypothetical protein
MLRAHAPAVCKPSARRIASTHGHELIQFVESISHSIGSAKRCRLLAEMGMSLPRFLRRCRRTFTAGVCGFGHRGPCILTLTSGGLRREIAHCSCRWSAYCSSQHTAVFEDQLQDAGHDKSRSAQLRQLPTRLRALPRGAGLGVAAAALKRFEIRNACCEEARRYVLAVAQGGEEEDGCMRHRPGDMASSVQAFSRGDQAPMPPRTRRPGALILWAKPSDV